MNKNSRFEVDKRWFLANMPSLIQGYGMGTYVAIHQGAVVAYGSDVDTVHAAVRKLQETGGVGALVFLDHINGQTGGGGNHAPTIRGRGRNRNMSR